MVMKVVVMVRMTAHNTSPTLILTHSPLHTAQNTSHTASYNIPHAQLSLQATVLEEMPPFPERDSSILTKLQKKRPEKPLSDKLSLPSLTAVPPVAHTTPEKTPEEVGGEGGLGGEGVLWWGCS